MLVDDEETMEVVVEDEGKQAMEEDSDGDDDDNNNDDDSDNDEASIEEGDQEEEEEEEHEQDTAENHNHDDEDDDENRSPGGVTAVPFLDTFYVLTSSDSRERSQAAQDMIRHCLLGPKNNTQDAAYALKRLMQGLCSGRAAARQGCASALASFLKIAYKNKCLADIQNEYSQGKDSSASLRELSCLAFVRQRLLDLTSPTSAGSSGGGKHSSHGRRAKSSEDRDCKFGLLFGILSIVRSGILLHPLLSVDHTDHVQADAVDDLVAVSCAMAKDLSDLYHYKKWLREPAAHAIGTLLNSFYAMCKGSSSDHAALVVSAIVNKVVIPTILQRGDEPVGQEEPQQQQQKQKQQQLKPPLLYDAYSAEQVAILLNIQVKSMTNSITLAKPFDQPLLTKDSIPRLATSLSETSREVHPRTHLLWDAFFYYISEPVTGDNENGLLGGVDVRGLRKQCYGKHSSVDLVAAVVQHIIVDQLIKVDSSQRDSGGGAAAAKSTKMNQERGALALCLIRNLSGVEFPSSITGRTRLLLDPDLIENHVFCPNVVQPLFTSILVGRTGGSNPAQSAPLLRPLSIQILESIVDSIEIDSKPDRRLAFARPLLRCEPRLDSKAKTNVIARLVKAEESFGFDKDPSLFEELASFLVRQIAATQDDDGDANNDRSSAEAVTPHKAEGYMDLLFNYAKTVLSNQHESSKKGTPDIEGKTQINNSASPLLTGVIQRVQGILMCAAFFDCNAVVQQKSSAKKSSISGTGKAAVSAAVVFKASRAAEKSMSLLPLHVRTVSSARFFSLLASTITMSLRSSHHKDQTTAADLLLDVQRAWDALEQTGARSIEDSWRSDTRSHKDAVDPRKLLLRFQQKSEKLRGSSKSSDELKRCSLGFSLLLTTLYISLLDCGGEPNESNGREDSDGSDVNHSSVVLELFSDTNETAELFSGKLDSVDCPLSRLSVVCSNILSSPLAASTQSHGAYPTLLREVVKNAWVCALNLSDTAPRTYCKDPNFVDILLESIGAPTQEDAGEVSDESESDSDSQSDDEDQSQSTDQSHSDHRDGKDMVKDAADEEGGDDMQVDEDELDPERLQALLEEDSDASVNSGELEHHAGADAALAKFIQAKQDVRKAGRTARERTVIAGQLRCIMLLEALLVGKSKGRGDLLSIEKCLQMIVSLVAHRKELERALADKGPESAATSEKRDLLERLTSLLKTKLLRWKFSSSHWSESVKSDKDFCADICSRLLLELKGRISKEQRACCSLALASVLRAVPDAATKLEIAQVYEEAVREWSSKRTTRLESSLFDDLIDHDPFVAQASLPLALARAIESEARSPYLKTECFRLLSKLYNANLNKQKASELEKLAYNRIISATATVITAFSACLNDPDMRKAKRSREMLKGLEKIVDFVLSSESSSSSDASSPSSAAAKKQLSGLAELISNLKQSSDSPAVNASCERLLAKLASLVSIDADDGGIKKRGNGSGSKQHKEKPPTGVVEDDGDDDEDDDDDVDGSGTANSKRKRKKKKRKKGKK